VANIKVRGTQHTYQVSNEEAQEIKRIWKDDSYRPDQKIDLGPISFKKADVQIIEMGENVSYRRGIDLSDPIKREEVRQFEMKFNEWCQKQAKEKQLIEFWLEEKKIISFIQPPELDKWGYERYQLGRLVIHDPVAYTIDNQNYDAMKAMRNFASRSLSQDLETQKETLFESEEINVKDIPF